MRYTQLGKTGLKVSVICLGTMTFAAQADERESVAILDAAASAGVNFIDTADVYPAPESPDTVGRTEQIVGKWLKDKRDNFVLATKCGLRTGTNAWDRGLSRRHILRSVDDSLRRLDTDWIDLYQTHFPDASTPIEETLRALDDVVRSGKVRYIGCSNYQAWQLARALWTSDKLGLAAFATAQPRYNILFRVIEEEVLPLCRDQNIAVLPYNPLAGGFLSGKYHRTSEPEQGARFDVLRGRTTLYHDRYWQEAQFAAVEKLAQFCAGRHVDMATLAVAWVLSRDGVTSAIVGATRAQQLAGTLAALDLALDEDTEAVCDEAWYSLPRRRDPAIALR